MVSESETISGIKRIVIKGENGYFSYLHGYNDKLTLTKDSISYVLKPKFDGDEFVREQKWQYKTNATMFNEVFESIVSMAQEYIDNEPDVVACDVGAIDITITLNNSTKATRSFITGDEYFLPMFKLIRTLVPSFEETPLLLACTDQVEEEDYEA